MHGGVKKADLGRPDAAAVTAGLPNLEKHVENIRAFGEVPLVALNRFAADTDAEIEIVRRACEKIGAPFAPTDHFARGGEGALELARTLVAHAEKKARPYTPLYPLEASVPDKIGAVARRMYGAREVVFTREAERDLRDVERLGYAKLPVCIAKTPASLSDDPKLRGRPEDFDVTVRAIQINAGAGFLVVLTGDIMRMPGLPKRPLAERIDVRDGSIVGLE
jgi:formate--tetrahydrofolate ligase